MTFGKISNFIVIGGSSTALVVCRLVRRLGYPVAVFTGKRLLEESIGDKSLGEALEAEGYPFRCVEDIHSCPELESQIGTATFVFSIGSPWLFSGALLEQLKGRFVNIHPVSIPRMDGGAHFSWQILMNSRIGATTIQMVRKGLNRGELVHVSEYSFSGGARIPADYFRESEAHIHQTTEAFIHRLHRGECFTPIQPDLRFRTFYPRLYTDRHGYIDWNMDVEEIERFICAFDKPYGGAMTFLEGRRIHLSDAWIDRSEGGFHSFMRGIVYRKRPDCLQIACRGGALLVHRVTDDGGCDCLGTVALGKRLHTPGELLERALRYEAVFDAQGIVPEEEDV